MGISDTGDGELNRLPVSQIAERCAAETRRFFHRGGSDDRWCLELFRRAICEAAEEAWTHLYAVYQPQMAGWVRSCSGYREEWDAVDDFVQDAYRRFVKAMNPAKFAKFGSLSQLLSYLRMCVLGAVNDQARKAQRAVLSAEIPDHLAASGPGPGQTALDGEMARGFWLAIFNRLNSEPERIVIEEMFVYGHKPRHLAERFPEHFTSASQVSQVKHNLLDRLQRDPVLQRIWDDWQN